MAGICYPNTAQAAMTGECKDKFDAAPAEQQEIALSLAWSFFQMLTAYQVAICPVVVRPCRRGCVPGTYSIAPIEGPNSEFGLIQLPTGQLANVLLCSCGDDCSCGAVSEIILPGPVGAITAVKINGEVLASSAYRVDDARRLVRQDGGTWPNCQDLSKPAGEEDTFTVEYLRGKAPDFLDNYAVAVLACEFLAAINAGECRLPAGVTTIVRQGVTYEVERNWFAGGTVDTGIPEVNVIVSRHNPYGVRSGTQIFSPDVADPRITTSS